ncbi:MAG: hypothetical protein REI09_14335 [Candidatus Dactylopiibacterium sp.]|nr:hypothetical protein [Candidatus Dactylopiibacterium sp.]
MFEMHLPWYEFVIRGAVVYGVLLVMVRISGKRTVGQFTPFDLLVVMLLSEAVSTSLGGGDESLPGGLLVAATLVALNLLLAFATARSAAFERLVEGAPVLIARNGECFAQVLRSNHVSRGDFDKVLREQDCALADVLCAFLEVDGNISLIRRQ